VGVALAVLPALPLGKAGKYVAAAYVVVFAIVLIYVAIMALRLSRMERDLGELLELTDARAQADEAATDAEEGNAPLARETVV
jgi:hypothetical protein